MFDDVKPITGRKGGKGGGGGRAPYEAPDNLLADSTAYLIDVVSEGEIEGWADEENPAKCIYFDDTPLQNGDGSFNFEGVEYWLRTGTPNQNPVPGFAAVETEFNVGVEVEHAQPVARSVTAADVDAVRVKVGVSQLSTLETDTGDLLEASVDFDIEMQAGNGGWETVGSYTFSGKTTSGYQRAYRVELPEVRPVSIRVRRVTEDSEVSNIQDVIYFVSYTEIIDAKLRYPDTAYVALAIPAEAFGGRIPRRSYRLKGMKCWVPSNYDPDTRTYDESAIWNGTFKRAFTDNPAFFTYTVFRDDRWGLGERIAPDLVDKWRIYQIGKYCDQLVPDGLGGMEPRFTMNGVMNTREAAYQVITQLSAAFRGVTYWGAGAVVPVQDAPSDPVKIVTNANVVDGAFNYAGTGLPARKTAVVTSFRDPDDHFKVKAGVVFEDQDAIQRYGRRQQDSTLAFCTKRGEALRTAKWIVDTNTTARETVNYQAGYDHAALRPGDKILISDKHRVGFRMGGRILNVSADRRTVDLDAPVTLALSESYKLMLANDVGDYVERAVQAGIEGPVEQLPLTSALPANVQAGAVFVLTASNLPPRQFRVVSNTPEKHLFNIVALEDDPAKYDRVELGINVDAESPYLLPDLNAAPPRPVDLQVAVWYREQPAGLVATVSWSTENGQPATSYRVEFTNERGKRHYIRDVREQTIDIPLRGSKRGPYKVHVASENAFGTRSGYANRQFSVGNNVLVPDPVSGFRIRILGDRAQLTWDKGKAVVSHYHIRHLPPGSIGGWNEAVDIDRDVPIRSAMVPALPGTYLIKAVSVFGQYSPTATMAAASSLALSHFNVVKDLVAEPDFPGSRGAGLMEVDGTLQLLSDSPIGGWPSLSAVTALGHYGGIEANAVYGMAELVDLGDVYTSRLSASMQGYGALVSDRMLDWASLAALDNLAQVTDDLWSIELQVRHTDDSPSSGGAAWTDWETFYVGDYVARGFQFRVLFNSNDPAVSIVLNELRVKVDMPDRIAEGADIVCPAAGAQVTFNPPFMERPAIAVDGQELPSGARSIRTNVTRSGFHQQFVDQSGAGVACSFDWVAKGYGRVQ